MTSLKIEVVTERYNYSTDNTVIVTTKMLHLRGVPRLLLTPFFLPLSLPTNVEIVEHFKIGDSQYILLNLSFLLLLALLHLPQS